MKGRGVRAGSGGVAGRGGGKGAEGPEEVDGKFDEQCLEIWSRKRRRAILRAHDTCYGRVEACFFSAFWLELYTSPIKLISRTMNANPDKQIL